tara:strand:+ start:2769 stop:3119 length:351 start_codon:yes stop_codon:yes gene_type:complete
MIYRIAIVFLFLASCSSSEIGSVDEPDHLINRNKLTTVLVEMVKLEAYVESEYKTVTVYSEIMKKSADSLLNAYDITNKDYEENMEYYGAQHGLMQDINSDVLDELTKELGYLQSK